MRLVLCNAPPSDADRLARVVVEEGLAACVNAWPVTSTYRWEGAVLAEPETTLLIKTAADRVDALRARLLALHPYTLPEVLVLDVDAAASHPAYVAWVHGSTRPPETR
jgi:periplasmic divalent cation tolerance protein